MVPGDFLSSEDLLTTWPRLSQPTLLTSCVCAALLIGHETSNSSENGLRSSYRKLARAASIVVESPLGVAMSKYMLLGYRVFGFVAVP